MPNQAFYYGAGGTRVDPGRIHYLNVVPASGSIVNCSVFVIDEHRLATMHGREWIDQPVDVSAQHARRRTAQPMGTRRQRLPAGATARAVSMRPHPQVFIALSPEL